MHLRPAFLALLLVLAVCPYFIDLDGSSIWDANEAFYVETPREMIESGDYVSPSFNYEPRLNKPVLSYWIVAGFYHLFGVSPGVQRIPIAIGAVVMIGTAFLLAWAAASPAWGRAAGQAELKRRAPNAGDTEMTRGAPGEGNEETNLRAAGALQAALWAALGLAIAPRLLMFARRIFIDIYISMFMGLTLLAFVLAERYPRRRRTWLLLMYVAAALGVLTKGPIATVLPAAVFLAYLLVYRELRRLRDMMLPTGALVMAALVMPYYWALYARHGWAPIGTFLLGENVARFTEGVGVDSPRGPFFYLPVIFTDSFPWSLFLVASIGACVAAWRRKAHGAAEHRVRTLLWLWIAVIVLFFTASTAKQDLYIFPIVPAVAALGGLVVTEQRGWPVRGALLVVGAVAAVAGAGMLYLIGSPNGVYGVDGAPVMGAAGLGGGLLILAFAAADRIRPSLVAAVATFILLAWIFVLRVLPGFERYKPAPGFAATLHGRLQPGDVLVTYDEAMPSLVFYLRRHVDPLFDTDELTAAFGSGRTVYAIMSDRNYDALRPHLPGPTCIVESRPTFDVRLRTMLAREPLPELVLVSNRCEG